MTPAKRVRFGLVFAAAFGVAAGLFKGNDPGLRGGIGNLSAPWLLVALFPALHCRSVMRGALLGLASTLVAGEILVVALVHGHQLFLAPFYFSWGVTDWTPYIGESIVGIAIVLAALFRKRSHAATR